MDCVLTIPALALFFQPWMLRSISTEQIVGAPGLRATYKILPLVNGWVWISPVFVVIQLVLFSRGTAAASFANVACVAVTIIAAVMMWTSQLAWGGRVPRREIEIHDRMKTGVLFSVLLVVALHALAILVMAGSYFKVPREFYGIGVFIGPELQIAGFILTLIVVGISKDARRSVTLGVLSAVAIVAFIHRFFNSPL